MNAILYGDEKLMKVLIEKDVLINNKNEVLFKPADYTDADGYVNGTDNTIKYSALGTKNAAIEIPSWYFVKGNNIITYEKKDFANNQVKETVQFSYPWKIECEGLFPFKKADDVYLIAKDTPFVRYISLNNYAKEHDIPYTKVKRAADNELLKTAVKANNGRWYIDAEEEPDF